MKYAIGLDHVSAGSRYNATFPADGRIAAALVVSTVCHFALVGLLNSSASSRLPDSEPQIKVRLTESRPAPASEPAPQPPAAEPERRTTAQEAPAAVPEPALSAPSTAATEEAQTPEQSSGEEEDDDALSQATSTPQEESPAPELGASQDPVFYPAAELDVLPTTLDRPRPQLSFAPEAAELKGIVTLRVVIDPAGTVIEASVVYANPPGVFDAAAIEAVRAMRYTPGEKQGKSVGSEIFTSIAFGPHMPADAYARPIRRDDSASSNEMSVPSSSAAPLQQAGEGRSE